MSKAPGPRLKFYGTRLLVRDFARSWRFYRDVLGLAPVRGHGEPPYGGFLEGNRDSLALFDQGLMAQALGLPSGGSRGRSVGRSVLVFEVPDVDAAWRTLTKRGAEPVKRPANRKAWGLRAAHVRDPDGNLIELYTPLPRK